MHQSRLSAAGLCQSCLAVALVSFLTVSRSSAQTCNADYNLDGQVTVNELVLAVGQALNGCPPGQPIMLSGQTMTRVLGTVAAQDTYEFDLLERRQVDVQVAGVQPCLEIRGTVDHPTVEGGETECADACDPALHYRCACTPLLSKHLILEAGRYFVLIGVAPGVCADFGGVGLPYSISYQSLP
jgi:hypothetical protein